MDNIVILTGAGISAESGLGTFRDTNGLWTQYDLEDVATPEGFARDPDLVHEFYNHRRAKAAEARPNDAHRALARLERDFPGRVSIVTQNVDALHETAGSRTVLHMHGELANLACEACGVVVRDLERFDPGSFASCAACDHPRLRPDVVWFGEVPRDLDAIGVALATCTHFLALGTSGAVYPAAACSAARVSGTTRSSSSTRVPSRSSRMASKLRRITGAV